MCRGVSLLAHSILPEVGPDLTRPASYWGFRARVSSAIPIGCGDGCGRKAGAKPGARRLHIEACIALQYGLDYPEEVQGLVLMTVAMRPKHESKARMTFAPPRTPVVYDRWIDAIGGVHFVSPSLARALIVCHRQVEPRSSTS